MFEMKDTAVNIVKILGWNPGDNSIFWPRTCQLMFILSTHY